MRKKQFFSGVDASVNKNKYMIHFTEEIMREQSGIEELRIKILQDFFKKSKTDTDFKGW